MATLSHAAFRMIVEKCGGADEYFTEMINAASLVTGGPFEEFYIENAPCPQKIVWQLTGTKAESLAKAAHIVAQKGGIGVDINMGCSAPQIYKTGAGIAWMLKPLSETRAAVRAVKEALSCAKAADALPTDAHLHKAADASQTAAHVAQESHALQTDAPLAQSSPALQTEPRLSVKCRLGAEDFSRGTLFAFTDMLAQEGVSLITLHPRTIKEKERFSPRFEYAQEIAERYKGTMQVCINGCIKDKDSLNSALKKAPSACAVMISRAAAQAPWIFSKLKGSPLAPLDLRQIALDFIDAVEKHQPKEFYKTRIQRFFSYYCKNFSFGHYFANQMLNYHSLEESRQKVYDYFQKQSSEQWLCVQ